MEELFPSIQISSSSIEIKINIEYDKDILSVKEFDRRLSSTMKKLANEARDFWQSEAGRRLKTSRSEYQNAISLGEVGDERISIQLEGGFLPYAVEMGTSSYNMNIKRGQIVPLNVNREENYPFQNPVFRQGDGDSWVHPGFEGQHIRDSVVTHLKENVISEQINELFEDL